MNLRIATILEERITEPGIGIVNNSTAPSHGICFGEVL